MERAKTWHLRKIRGALLVFHPVLKMCITVVFSFLFLRQMSRVCVCVSAEALLSLSPFPSEVFGQLWLAVCITGVVTLTSCLIPGPLSLIDGQSKHCGLAVHELVQVCVWLCINIPGLF